MAMRSNIKCTYVNETTGEQLIFTSGRASPYFINDIDGISSVDNTLYTFKGSGQHGETVTGMTLEPRIITVDGQIRDNTDKARKDMLTIINPLNRGKLIYTDGKITRHILCHVRKSPVIANSGIFPAFQFELYCAYPFFLAGSGASQNKINIAFWEPLFEFELEIPAEGIEFETRKSELIANVKNTGDTDIGAVFEIRVNGNTANPKIINVLTEEYIEVEDMELLSGDIVRINTIERQERAVLIRNRTETDITNHVSLSSEWLQLRRGDNVLTYTATVRDNIDITIYYDNAYLGV